MTFFVKLCRISPLTEIIQKQNIEHDRKETERMQENKAYKMTFDIMSNELKIPMKYKGFTELVEIISLKSENLLVSNYELYKQIAKKHNVRPSCVSTNIGKVVNIANGTMDQKEKDKYFKAAVYSGGYITTATFINSLANHLRAKM